MLKKLFSAGRQASPNAPEQPSHSTADDTKPNLVVQQQLQQLNLDFLNLLQTAQQQGSDRWIKQLGLGTELDAVLQRCDHTHLSRIADCGFAVFSVAFAEPASWYRLHQFSQRIAPEDRYATLTPRTETMMQRFCVNLCQSVLFFAWHLCKQQPHWARRLLGMPDGTQQVIVAMDIWQCQFVAYQYPHLLQPRWRSSAKFWTDALHYGLTGDIERERMLRSVARHLTASELEPSAIMRLSGEEPDQTPIA